MIDDKITEVQERMVACLRSSSLRREARRYQAWLGRGKMLRARLLLRVGAGDVPSEDALCAATAVELIHVASLLHDDVIDGGRTRRGRPAVWVEEGVRGAVLLGDLLVSRAFALVLPSRDASLARVLVESVQEMCDAEALQELVLKGRPADWETCVSVARAKTGSLFAFAAYAGAAGDPPLRAALREAGYAVGTAYQLADDVFDAHGDPLRSDKTLGTDAANGKPTTASAAAAAGVDPGAYLSGLCERARASLAQWPAARDGWDAYMERDMKPALARFLGHTCAQALS
ncbi:MAG: polyprenyl synthetase family protein [Lentisphaerae bacterium]|nr:polyprenyl synthetase family protein [Lentisphaerota bacterium]